MKGIFTVLFVLAALSLFLIIPALAAPIPINEVDKFTVNLPAGAVTGSVILCDGPVAEDKKSCVDNKLSDVVVFLGTVGGVPINKATMFSDKESGEGDKPDNPNADLANLMASIMNPSKFLAENVNEGGKEDTPYSPAEGEPGFVDKDTTYIITSDQPVSQNPPTVAEPSTLLFLGSGLAVLGASARRRHGQFPLCEFKPPRLLRRLHASVVSIASRTARRCSPPAPGRSCL